MHSFYPFNSSSGTCHQLFLYLLCSEQWYVWRRRPKEGLYYILDQVWPNVMGKNSIYHDVESPSRLWPIVTRIKSLCLNERITYFHSLHFWILVCQTLDYMLVLSHVIFIEVYFNGYYYDHNFKNVGIQVHREFMQLVIQSVNSKLKIHIQVSSWWKNWFGIASLHCSWIFGKMMHLLFVVGMSQANRRRDVSSEQWVAIVSWKTIPYYLANTS